MSLVLTVVPILLGFKDIVGSIKYIQETWKFVYQFIYAITGVALAEEIVFRGYILANYWKLRTKVVCNYCIVITVWPVSYSTEI